MTARNKGIIAYGTDSDRRKLAELAALAEKSASEFLIDMIRSRHAELFGESG